MPAFTPTAVLPGGKSGVTGGVYSSRRSTSDEQREEAVRHAGAWMAEHRIWMVEVEVHWTRRDATVLIVRGHGERLNGATVPAIDRVTEQDADGRAIVTSPAERHLALEAELGEIYAEGLD